MDSPVVCVEKLSKTYLTPVRPEGLQAAFKSLFNRTTKAVKAVESIGFEIAAGEIVGFLGPNGAGKTTTLKMLSGLLHPTGGMARVLGHDAKRREHAFLRQITLVMGQRNQLVWDIPASDSFALNKKIYNVPDAQFKETLAELTELLELAPLVSKPVRNLSLGERMKCEVAGALLHRPKVLFLDEPTLGLDVTAQRRIREFIKTYNARHNSTVLLTSHYMADVEALAKRVLVIHHGKLLFDGPLADLVTRFSPHKTIILDFEPCERDPANYGTVVKTEAPGRVTLSVPKDQTAAITARLLQDFTVKDLTVEDPSIEEVIEMVFADGTRQETATPSA
ncbi:MAG: ATP-binding cassette domain-containing protein [Verrucomicrobiota bacterium]|nr:ATP-binding cassette domain-containing protein [Verrucomicrobiota bacterium]